MGGSGFYGRHLVADLLRFTGAQVLVVSRRAPQRLTTTDRVVPIACDLRDPRALREAIRGSAVVVHYAGPFQHLPLEPLQAAIANGVHYVDISEDRAYRREVLAMETEACAAGIVVLNGASVVPGMQALFSELLRPRFDELLAVCGSAAPDTRRHRGHAMFHTMLLGAGRPFQAPRNGLLVRVYGWREPAWFDFPHRSAAGSTTWSWRWRTWTCCQSCSVSRPSRSRLDRNSHCPTGCSAGPRRCGPAQATLSWRLTRRWYGCHDLRGSAGGDLGGVLAEDHVSSVAVVHAILG